MDITDYINDNVIKWMSYNPETLFRILICLHRREYPETLLQANSQREAMVNDSEMNFSSRFHMTALFRDEIAGKSGKTRKEDMKNFLSHVRSAHLEYLAALLSDTHSASATSQQTSQCHSLFYCQRTLNISRWLSLIVKAFLAFNITQNDEFRRFSKYSAIDVKTLAKIMELLTEK